LNLRIEAKAFQTATQMAITPKTEKTNKPSKFRRIMSIFDLSEFAANTIYSISNVAVLLASIVGVGGAIGLFWAGGVKEKYADIKELETAERISETDAKAAEANKSAAEAKLELAKLQSKLAWRTVSIEDENRMVEFLRDAPKGYVGFMYMSGDLESRAFALRLSQIFKKAGYETEERAEDMSEGVILGGGSIENITGIQLMLRDERVKSAPPIQNAFKLIGINASGIIDPVVIEGAVVIRVSPKPPQ
jgi:hypothetical protein